MKKIKKYIIPILAIIIIALLLGINHGNRVDYDDMIKTKNDSIEVLSNQNQILQIQFERSQDLFVQSENDILKYQDSISILRNRNYRIRRTYENQIADIIAIPTDSLYRDLTGWLDKQ